MDDAEIKKLTETVEAGLRDGRSLDSLRTAMQESGYGEDQVRKIIAGVDRKKIIRRPQRKRHYDKGWIAASVLIIVVVILGAYIFMIPPAEVIIPEVVIEPTADQNSTCYVVDESVKDFMIEAGADCDRWILIKEI